MALPRGQQSLAARAHLAPSRQKNALITDAAKLIAIDAAAPTLGSDDRPWGTATCDVSSNDGAGPLSSARQITSASKKFGGGHRCCAQSPKGSFVTTGGPPPWKYGTVALAYLRAAQAYMLISMPTGTSTIFGVFQVIEISLAAGTTDCHPGPTIGPPPKYRKRAPACPLSRTTVPVGVGIAARYDRRPKSTMPRSR